MVNDSDYREAPLAAVDTTYPLTQKGADTPGPFIVPSTAKMITKIRINFGSLEQDLYTGTTTAVHIFGGGLVNVGLGWFVGPMMACASAANTSGPVLQMNPFEYRTRIPVVPGQQISAEGFMHGEDPVSGHICLGLEYDGPFPGRIVDSDYREETVGAAANTYTRLGVRGAGVAEPDFSPKGTIGEVISGFIVDPDGHATDSFTIAPVIKLTGEGLLINGNYDYPGPWGLVGPDVDVAGGDLLIHPTRYETNIPVKKSAGATIRASGQNVESASEGHAICGLCYL
ncbi:MAG: hypothetical protein ACFFDT_07775 [Candidatus Hodarchaeota archaeon]